MDSDETPLERARKRLLDCEALEAQQAARVENLKRRGLDSKREEDILAVMKKTTGFMREDFMLEQQRASLKTGDSGMSVS